MREHVRLFLRNYAVQLIDLFIDIIVVARDTLYLVLSTNGNLGGSGVLDPVSAQNLADAVQFFLKRKVF